MAVEIREIVIKTEITSRQNNTVQSVDSKNMEVLKRQIIEECLRTFKHKTKNDGFNR